MNAADYSLPYMDDMTRALATAWEQGRRDGERNAHLGTNEPNPYEDAL